MSPEGALVWYIPDTYLPTPTPGDGPYVGHEAVCILNVTHADANVHFDLYFEDRPPIEAIPLSVPGQRTRHIRLDKPEQLNGTKIPIGVPYAIRVRSDVPVIVQYSRLDTTQVQATLMTTMAHPASDQ
jgi:hypothetical protein